MEKNDILLLPACIVHMVIDEFNEKNKEFGFIVLITLVFLPLGVASLVAAIEAANVLGILVYSTDIAFDIAVLVVNTPDFAEEHPKQTELINTLAFFYGLGRLGYGLRNLPKLYKHATTPTMKTLLATAIIAGVMGCSFSKDIQVEMASAQLIKIDTIYRNYDAVQKQLTWQDENKIAYVCFAPMTQSIPVGTKMFIMRRR
ncbi:MAG TPA: hypothetical protein VF476_14695 [Chitinophagaceae bacterium]